MELIRGFDNPTGDAFVEKNETVRRITFKLFIFIVLTKEVIMFGSIAIICKHN